MAFRPPERPRGSSSALSGRVAVISEKSETFPWRLDGVVGLYWRIGIGNSR